MPCLLRMFSFFLCISFSICAASEEIKEFGPAFDVYVNKAMKEWGVSGAAIAVVHKDKVIFSKGYGVRGLDDSRPVDSQTLFSIGSTTKAFTAAALALLVDEGKISWDDRVASLLPGFMLQDAYASREATVRDLLSHRLGFPSKAGDLLFTYYDREEIVRRLQYIEPASSFRSKFAYQNMSFIVAGEIVRHVTGQSWDDFVEQHIVKPLGMKETDISTEKLRVSENVARAHFRIRGKNISTEVPVLESVGPAGAMVSSADEMTQWLRLQLGKGTVDGKKYLSSAIVAEMQSPQMMVPLDRTKKLYHPEAHMLAYGMGWYIADYKGNRVLDHGGNLPGMTSTVALMPEKDFGLVVLTNQDDSGLAKAIMYRIIDECFDYPEHDWSREILAGYHMLKEQENAYRMQAIGPQVPDTEPSHDLQSYVGTYYSPLYGEATVQLSDGQLRLSYGSDVTGNLGHWHYDTFRVTWNELLGQATLGDTLVNFVPGHDGQIQLIRILGVMDFQKVPEA
ncbi:MAG: hypothetical protein CMO81_11120 [Waddliaceae bacterium]|nr:hypothetical protein [Waddliaceae bacterium]